MTQSEGGNFLDDLVAKAKDLGEHVKEFAEDAFDNVKEFASDAGENIKEFASEAEGNIKDFAEDAGDNIKNFAEDAKHKLGLEDGVWAVDPDQLVVADVNARFRDRQQVYDEEQQQGAEE